MKRFDEAIQDYPVREGYRSVTFGEQGEFELAFEPLLFDQYYVALYRDGVLLADKVPVRPGGPGKPAS